MSRDFDGVDDIINCGSPAAFDNQEPLTWLLWALPRTSGEGGGGRFLAKGGGVGEVRLFFAATNRLRFNKNYATTNLDRQSANDTITLSTWQHLTVTWDGSATAANVLLYKNATEVSYASTTNGVGTKNSDAALNFNIGNDTDTTRTFDGALAHVHFYDRVLSADEIAQVMRYPASISRNLIGYWPCFGVTSPEPDLSGGGNDGTVTGAASSADNPPINGLFIVPQTNLWYATPSAAAAPAAGISALAILGVGS